MNNLFIFTGVDGCGKTTIIKEVYKKMENISMMIKEPFLDEMKEEIKTMITQGYEHNEENETKIANEIARVRSKKYTAILNEMMFKHRPILLSDRGFIDTLAYQNKYNDDDYINKVINMHYMFDTIFIFFINTSYVDVSTSIIHRDGNALDFNDTAMLDYGSFTEMRQKIKHSIQRVNKISKGRVKSMEIKYKHDETSLINAVEKVLQTILYEIKVG